jgi:hypothetical protein
VNRRASPPLAFALLALVSLAALTSCDSKKESHWESVCQIVNRTEVHKDPDGTVTLVDMELEWDPCPGDQFQVIRGGKAFAACSAKFKEGQLVPVHVLHYWDDRGFYRWTMEKVGDCAANVQRDDRGSFEKGQTCEDVVFHGRNAGFHCSRRPEKRLISICPWMARQ